MKAQRLALWLRGRRRCGDSWTGNGRGAGGEAGVLPEQLQVQRCTRAFKNI